MGAHFTIKVSHEIREGFPEYEKLVEGFRQHIRGQTPAFLGRDVAYDHHNTPPTVKLFLRHIHICIPLDDHPPWWETVTEVFRRTNLMNSPEKDYALVYCYDDLQDIYYLLTIIGPDAHNNTKWMSHLRYIAIKAEQLITRSSVSHK